MSRPFLLSLGLLCALFAIPLYQDVRFALGSELYSYVILVPAVSAYLIWVDRRNLQAPKNVPTLSRPALAAGAAGIAVTIAYVVGSVGGKVSAHSAITLAMCALVLLMATTCLLFCPREDWRRLGFPLVFLVFIAPLPPWLEQALEHQLQHGSATIAHWLFLASGTPVFRDDTFFLLPGIKLEVAPECSGIHSTLALLLTSLVAGQILLRSNGNRIILSAFVVPVALIRNGFRVFTIGQLCIRIGPEMIHSPIHKHGGPLFFALSLVPFSLVLFFLIRRERRAAPIAQSHHAAS